MYSNQQLSFQPTNGNQLIHLSYQQPSKQYINNNYQLDYIIPNINPSPKSHPQVSQYKYLIYQNKIQILTDRLNCYIEESQNFKRTNTILVNRLSTLQQLDNQLQKQKSKNQELRQQLDNYRDQIDQYKYSHQKQIQQLKQLYQQKQHFVNLMNQQHQKIIKKKDQEINSLKQKINKLQHLQKKIHSLEIQRLNSQEDFYQRDSIMTRSNLSQFTSQNSQNINTLNMQKSNVSTHDKAKQFMKRDRNQLIVMMKSLKNAEQCLNIGQQQASMIVLEKNQQRSMINGLNASHLSRSKINKTYYK